MERITYEKACKLVKKGKLVKCRINSRELVIVKDQNDLDAKKRLGKAKVQEFELYYDKPITQVPDNAIELTVDDAFELVNAAKTICYIANGKEESVKNTMQLSAVIRSANVRHEKPLMYWYV